MFTVLVGMGQTTVTLVGHYKRSMEAISAQRGSGGELLQLGNPNQVLSNSDYYFYCLPTERRIRVERQGFRAVSYVLIIQEKSGNDWWFLDGNGFRRDPQMLQELLPELPEDFEAPRNFLELL